MSAPRTCECMACEKCRVREWARNRYRLKAYGQWSPSGDLNKVVAHLKELREQGVGVNAITIASGVSRSRVQHLLSGKATRVGTPIAAKLLTVNVDGARRIPAYKVARRLRALNAIGYSTRDLGARLGMTQDTVSDHLSGKRAFVFTPTLEAVTKLYNELSMTPGPNKASARIAAKRGYAPPLAWDDIDDEDEQPSGVYRPLQRRTSDELLEEFAHLTGLGVARGEAARQLGVRIDAVEKAAERANQRAKDNEGEAA